MEQILLFLTLPSHRAKELAISCVGAAGEAEFNLFVPTSLSMPVSVVYRFAGYSYVKLFFLAAYDLVTWIV